MLSPQSHRRSARIAIHIPVEVSGREINGRTFSELARTESISEHGGCLVLKRTLAPQQELFLRRPQGRETAARVIGEVKRTHEGTLYGVSFVEGGFDFWGIHFPATPLKLALFRVLLECVHCAAREVIGLSDKQLELLDDEGRLARDCNTCGKRTEWIRTEYETGRPRANVSASPARPTENRRKALRAKLKLTACIRKPGTEEVVPIVDVSRGGLRFKTQRLYAAGNCVQVAVPFTKDAANIFVPAQIVWQDRTAGPEREYGLKYLK
jgi:PilZ domain